MKGLLIKFSINYSKHQYLLLVLFYPLAIFRLAIFLTDNSPTGNFPAGNLPTGNFPSSIFGIVLFKASGEVYSK
jgi:hypothetical protein